MISIGSKSVSWLSMQILNQFAMFPAVYYAVKYSSSAKMLTWSFIGAEQTHPKQFFTEEERKH